MARDREGTKGASENLKLRRGSQPAIARHGAITTFRLVDRGDDIVGEIGAAAMCQRGSQRAGARGGTPSGRTSENGHVNEAAQVLTVREAVYDGTFSTPKTDAGVRLIPFQERLFIAFACSHERPSSGEPRRSLGGDGNGAARRSAP